MGLASQSHGIWAYRDLEGATGLMDYRSLRLAFGGIGSRNPVGILSDGYPYDVKWIKDGTSDIYGTSFILASPN